MACSVFLSRCLPFFLHPSWWCWCWHWLSVCVRALVLCLHTPDCSCLLVIGFRGVNCDLTSLVCVCHFVVCLAIMPACLYIHVCVAACCSVVASPWSVFLFSGSAAGAGGQALHHASQRRAAPEHPGQAEETLWRGDCSPAGTQISYGFMLLPAVRYSEQSSVMMCRHFQTFPSITRCIIFKKLQRN